MHEVMKREGSLLREKRTLQKQSDSREVVSCESFLEILTCLSKRNEIESEGLGK